MNHDYADPSFARREWYSDAFPYGSGTGRHGSPADSLHSKSPLVPPEPGWDPVEELAYLLQEAVPAEQASNAPPPRSEPASGADFADPMENLAQITAQLPPIRRSAAGHRKISDRKPRLNWLQTGSFVIIAFVAVIVAMVSVFGGMVAYAPLQNITSGTKSGGIPWWPLLVYGPWMVASLSILRTALHQRRAFHSWFIVLVFSSVAMMLCVAQAERTFTGIAGAALPALASLACFQQLVRQITLTLPPRQGTPRHRQLRQHPHA
ncbi:DUF2637 domain-containing protein [Streptomyces aurantiogriseus]|uniref:Integral membrane protein n=1 Tax=Streptomyces aurantiogriseus TaxID=66870 RepID=A0A918BU98_9ACTN|nr:DUF2637 domain-containing protein [Streptomyces aurantiogriseus]GGQ91545.1 hypothetical protein GCM10010251_02460 [Streptomyces aurantiogriseus]